MKFSLLLKLELNQTAKKLPKIIFGAMALIIIICAIAFCGNKYLYNLPVEPHINIALCVEDDSSLMTYITEMVTNSDSIKEYATFIKCNKENLTNILDNGEAVAGVILQENAANDIMNGTNTPVEVVFPKNSGFEAALVKEIAVAVANLLSTAQAGIYTSIDFYNDNYKYSAKKDMLDRINYKYIKMVLFRESAFDNKVVEGTGDVSLLNYYITTGIVVFLILFAINISSTYPRYLKHLRYKLANNNVGIFKQLLIKFVCMLLPYFALITLALPVLIYVLSFKAAFCIYIGTLISAVAIASMMQIIFELFEESTSCILFIFLFGVILAFISGCFIPSLMLPHGINLLASFSPTHYSMELINSIFTNSFNGVAFVLLLVFTIINLGITYGLCSLKFRKENS